MRKRLLGMLLLAWSLPLTAAPEAGSTFRDWVISCETLEEQEHCYITQNVSLKESGQRVLHVAIGALPGTEQRVAIVTVPLGSFLPAGLGMSVDGGETRPFPFQYCIAAGCRGVLPLDDAMTSLLKAGRQGQVTFQDNQRRTIGVPLSLLGLTAGMAALDQ